ncbi:MAG TPA: GntR family transcriptional regulator [Baekduia sp.]|nr:GntR family transcriptional regulator [Baekduia sp.]
MPYAHAEDNCDDGGGYERTTFMESTRRLRSAKGAPRTTSGSLTDAAYAALRRRIISCELEPGQTVTESRLAEEIGFGKTPTRDALARLASDRLVRPMTRVGYEVTPLTMGDVAYLFETWRVIVCEASAIVAERADDDTRARVRELTLDWAPGEPLDPTEVRDHLDSAPFGAIFVATGNPIMIEMARPVVGLFERLMNFALLHGSWRDAAFAERRDAIHEAWERHDPDAARVAMREMVDFGEREVARILGSLDSVMNAPLGVSR